MLFAGKLVVKDNLIKSEPRFKKFHCTISIV